MSEALPAINVDDRPELKDLVRCLIERAEPIVLRSGNQDVAVLTPLPTAIRGLPRPSPEQVEVAMSAVGRWRGLVDVDALKEQWRAARGSNRPPIDL